MFLRYAVGIRERMYGAIIIVDITFFLHCKDTQNR